MPITLNTEIHKIINKVNKKWQQEEGKEQRKKHEEEEEYDAINKGIYSLVILYLIGIIL